MKQIDVYTPSQVLNGENPAPISRPCKFAFSHVLSAMRSVARQQDLDTMKRATFKRRAERHAPADATLA